MLEFMVIIKYLYIFIIVFTTIRGGGKNEKVKVTRGRAWEVV